jgi:hypothetical protein
LVVGSAMKTFPHQCAFHGEDRTSAGALSLSKGPSRSAASVFKNEFGQFVSGWSGADTVPFPELARLGATGCRSAAKLLTKDEAHQTAVTIVKVPDLLNR